MNWGAIINRQNSTPDNKERRTKMAMAWIAYRKAYGSVPHSLILRAM